MELPTGKIEPNELYDVHFAPSPTSMTLLGEQKRLGKFFHLSSKLKYGSRKLSAMQMKISDQF